MNRHQSQPPGKEPQDAGGPKRPPGSKAPASQVGEKQKVTDLKSGSAKKGRPRDLAAKTTILEITKRQAAEKTSYKDLSIEAIAQEAGVAKSTIYRWWKSKAELVREAAMLQRFVVPNTGRLQTDLEDLIRQEIQVQTTGIHRVIMAGIWAEMVYLDSQAPSPDEIAKADYEIEKRELISAIFTKARERGEWAGPFLDESVNDLLFGTVFYRCIGKGFSFSETAITRLASLLRQVAYPLSEAGPEPTSPD